MAWPSYIKFSFIKSILAFLEVSRFNIGLFLPPTNRVCGKVIFLHMCVILSTGGVLCLPQCMLGCHTPWEQTPPRSRHHPHWEQTLPLEQTPRADTPHGADTPRADTPQETTTPWETTTPQSRALCEMRSMRGWYESYWNAFLFLFCSSCTESAGKPDRGVNGEADVSYFNIVFVLLPVLIH